MAQEIERKFLITSDQFKELGDRTYFHQGFLNTHKERVVRIRIIAGKAYLTVKGITKGATRREYEYQIPLSDAVELLDNLCEKPTIKKYRYNVKHVGFIWEVDEFLEENQGLVVAEIELESEEQEFEKPDWIGKEVTGDPKYYNSNLVKNPFNNW